ncbi:UbiD family decarboxylase [Aquamicrobium segne]|uniref:UbiD family decarboxylase n=1 Tax=Aquamicrobium segne TaxID=469547 RepID=A0ABW0GTN1_9HYPH
MYQRTLPPFPTLGVFLEYLKAQGELETIDAPVSMYLEITELHRRVIATHGPALCLAKAQDRQGNKAQMPVVANLFGTPSRVAAGLGTDIEGLKGLGQMLAWLRSPQPPQSLREAHSLLPAARSALQARPRKTARPRKWRDLDPDFSLLPVQTCWPGDAGPLITWPVVITRPPGADDPASYNLGIYRMQVMDRDRAILRWLPMRGGAAHHRLWQSRGEDMPVAVVIGADPATMLGAVMPAPEGVSELALAGMIANRRASIAPCATIPLHVPASAEIILEGTVSPTEVALEGPFGDHTGYYNEAESYPVFTLKRLCLRDQAHYLTTFTGRAPDEPSVLGITLLEVFKPLLRQAIPEIIDIWMPPEACSYRIAVISIAKTYAGQARRVMMGFWALLPQFSMTKTIIVVDDDIDIRCWADVMWAVSTRMDAARDLLVIDRTPVDPLDFASPLEGLGGKMGLDATRKIGTETRRNWPDGLVMDASIAEQVTSRWHEFFPSDI